MNPNAFSTLPLKNPMLKNLASLDYNQMTPIQARSLPLILAGSDVIAQAKTGSGKINLFEFHTYVAIRRASAQLALARLSTHKIKGRFYKIRTLS